jgi:hypothetical protein
MADPGKGIDGWTQPPFRFAGLGMVPTVAHSDIVTSSLAGSGVALTAARSDILTAILTTKGAILLGGAASTVGALAVGTNTQALVADSTQTLGAKWAGETAWTTPTLNANWTQGTPPLRYRKDALGFVHLQGEIQVLAGATNPFSNFPAGYRPGVTSYFPVTGGPAGSFVLRQVGIGNTGDFVGNGLATNDFLIFDGVTWLAEA